MLKLDKINLPFLDTKKETYVNPPVVGDYFGKTPTFAWVKDEYHHPEKMLETAPSKFAHKVSGFFDEVGSVVASAGQKASEAIKDNFILPIAKNPQWLVAGMVSTKMNDDAQNIGNVASEQTTPAQDTQETSTILSPSFPIQHVDARVGPTESAPSSEELEPEEKWRVPKEDRE